MNQEEKELIFELIKQSVYPTRNREYFDDLLQKGYNPTHIQKIPYTEELTYDEQLEMKKDYYINILFEKQISLERTRNTLISLQF